MRELIDQLRKFIAVPDGSDPPVDGYRAYPLDHPGSVNDVTLIVEVCACRGDRRLETKDAMAWRVEDGTLKPCWHMCLGPEK